MDFSTGSVLEPYRGVLVLPQFGSEPRVELEPFRTGPEFSSKFNGQAELNLPFSSRFRQEEGGMNLF